MHGRQGRNMRLTDRETQYIIVDQGPRQTNRLVTWQSLFLNQGQCQGLISQGKRMLIF